MLYHHQKMADVLLTDNKGEAEVMADITSDQWLAAANRQSHYLSVERFNDHVDEIALRLNKPRADVLAAIDHANHALIGYGEPWRWAYSTLEVLRALCIGDAPTQ